MRGWEQKPGLTLRGGGGFFYQPDVVRDVPWKEGGHS